LVIENFVSDLYPEHSLGMPILGTEESINNMTNEKLLEYRSKFYRPGSIIVAVAGKIDHENILSLVEKSFHLEKTDPAPMSDSPNGTLRTGVNKVNSPISQSHLCVGFRAIPYKDERRYSLLVINTILSGGMSTRLFQNIREKYGFVYSVYSFPEFMSDTGYFCTYAGTDASKTDMVIDLIKEELRKLKTEPVKSDEINSARAQWKGGALISMESMMARMNRIAMREMNFGTYAPVSELIEKIDAVQREDVLSISEDIFDEDKIVISVIQPEE